MITLQSEWTREQAKQAVARGLKAPAKRKKVRFRTGSVRRVGQKWQATAPRPKRKYLLGLHPTEEVDKVNHRRVQGVGGGEG